MSRTRLRYERDDGCIVTWRDSNGVDAPIWEPGPSALRQIAKRIPPGSLRTICTPGTILRDLQSDRVSADPYAVERQELGRIGRLDLLPDHAQQQAGVVTGHTLMTVALWSVAFWVAIFLLAAWVVT